MIHSIPAGQRNGYFLDVISASGSIRTIYCQDLASLVEQAHQQMRLLRDFYNPWAWIPNASAERRACARLKAYSHRGKALNIQTLLNQDFPSRPWRSSYFQHGYTRRQGPVAGIRKGRGGPHFTNCATTQERRLNAGWMPEEGEVECREVRRENHLPNSWDGRNRKTQRCWKSQHKGCKSWDRN